MYARTVGSRELTFGVSGMLWRENLVMYDRQTESWWAQASGLAINGQLKGATLTMYPSSMMTWKEWRTRHPETLVLENPAGPRALRDAYATYHTGDGVGVTGFTRFTRAEGLDAKARVAGFRTTDQAFAVLAKDIANVPVFLADAGGVPVVVATTEDRSGVRVFRTGAHRFDVVTRGGLRRLVDAATKSEWDPFAGKAVSGALAGRQLEEIPSTLSYWFAWRAFFPRAILLRPR